MESLLPTLVLIVLALLGARWAFPAGGRPRLASQLLIRTGTPFLAVGFALGPNGLGLLTADAIAGLHPLLGVGLGWVGFHFGLQLDYGSVGRFPRTHYVFAIGQASLTLVLFSAVGLAVTEFARLGGPVPALLVLVAACTASVTAPTATALVSTTFRVRGPVRDLLLFVGSIDAVVGIVALQIVYSLFRPASIAEGFGAPSQLLWVGLAAGVGMLCGIVLLWLTRSRPSGEELVLYLIGACAFASGIALQWDLSPLFVSMTMGALVANVSKSTTRLRGVLSRWEKPVYVTFLLLTGALLRLPGWLVGPLALAYVGIRFTAKLVSAGLLARRTRFAFAVPAGVGLGLIPQGGISLAMAVSAALMYPEIVVGSTDADAALFAVIVIGVALSELLGPLLALRTLRGAGEVGAHADRAEPAQPG